MTCVHCGHANSSFESRCTRCGGHLGPSQGSFRFTSGEPALPTRDSRSVRSFSGPMPFLVKGAVAQGDEFRASARIPNRIMAPPEPPQYAGQVGQAQLFSGDSTARQLDQASRPLAHPSADAANSPTSSGQQSRLFSLRKGSSTQRGGSDRPQLQVAAPARQPSLFSSADLGPGAPTFRPRVVDPSAPSLRADGPELGGRKPSRKRSRTDSLPFAQGTLDFLTPTSLPPRQLPTRVDASVLCDLTVAAAPRRVVAGLFDGIFGLLATALVAGISYAALHRLQIPLPQSATVLCGGMAAVWAVMMGAYYSLFAFLDADTPGQSAAGLQVMSMDGNLPRRIQRWQRLLGAIASLAPAGVGFVWALFDEEQLGWQDHVSNTFLTSRSDLESSFRRG